MEKPGNICSRFTEQISFRQVYGDGSNVAHHGLSITREAMTYLKDKGIDDRMRECPACGELISTMRVICPSCKARVYSLLVGGGENHGGNEKRKSTRKKID